jgi:hypothetical protein
MKMKWFLLFFVPAAALLSTSILLSDSKYYAARLFSPENLPNVGLLLAGIVGIFVANRTLKSIDRQAGLMTDQVSLMNKEFICTHPPKLVMRDLQMIPHATHPKVTVRYTISNSGSTQATVVESLIEVQKIDSGTGGPLRNSDGLNTIKNDIDNVLAHPGKALTIEPGGHLPCRHSSEVSCQPDPPLTPSGQIVQKAPNSPNFYFRGRVVYKDGNGTRRQMAFWQSYSFSTERFTPLDDPNFVYSD